MSGHLPHDAFDVYLTMGGERSYQALADKFGVSKQAVTKFAARGKWQQRLEAIEAQARASNDARAVEALVEINERRLKMWKMVEARALEAVRDHPLESGAEGVKALDYAHKNMRLISGEPTERTASTIEEISRREYARWLKKSDDTESSEAPAEMPEASVDAPRDEPSADLALLPPPSPEERDSDAGAAA